MDFARSEVVEDFVVKRTHWQKNSSTKKLNAENKGHPEYFGGGD
jgi:hypothetical protein